MWQLLRKNLYPILIVGLVILISLLSYKPGTFLTGWDTLHPEFDFGLNFERMINGVWREEQGLGALAGHTHMADLPRVAMLWILHFILPLSALRYTYIFLCLLLGPLGMYFLLKNIFSKISNFKIQISNLVAFLGSLFYLLNLGTLQQFYAPFEMFTTQYALLPWIIFFSIKFLHEDSSKRKKSLILFSLFTLLATPQAYAAHLWYPFFGVYTFFLILNVILNSFQDLNGCRNKFGMTKRAVALVVVTLFINSFWLMPNLYYIFTSSNVPKESKQNRIFSQEYRLRNQENGYIQDVALTKGFYFQWSAYNFGKNKFEFLMPEWREHIGNPVVQSIGYLFFGISLGGLILAIKRKQKQLLSFAPFVIIPFIFLMNHTPPFSWLFNYLLNFSLFEEAVRFIFTKLSILLVFGYTIFLGYFLLWLFDFVKTKKRSFILASLYLLLIVTFSFPIFQGHLISDKFKVKIPNQYFQLWEFMKTQPNETVLTLPLHTFSGWQYYNWAYQGSGLIWFGMKQPVLDRDSDRWSIANEQAFRELQYTLYSQRVDQFEKTLKKFGVGYIVWDSSVITPSEKNRNQILYQRETTTVLTKLIDAGLLKKINSFGSITVYKIQRPHVLTQEIKQIGTQVNPVYRWSFSDQAYIDHGDYISTIKSVSKIKSFNYPFRDFLVVTDRFKQEAALSISELPHPIRYPATRLISKQEVANVIELKRDGHDGVIRFKTKNTSNGISLQNDSFPHNLGYVVGFKSRNVQGLPLRFCLKNFYSNLCDIYDELSRSNEFVEDYFVVPPYEKGQGYGLYIDNISYGDYESVNELKEVVTYPLYYDYLVAQNDKSGGNSKVDVLTNHQSFHPGWLAFQVQISNFKIQILTEHVLVNNWENGWLLPNEVQNSNFKVQIYTIFWPQYLEYAGFLVIIITFACLFLSREKKPSS